MDYPSSPYTDTSQLPGTFQPLTLAPSGTMPASTLAPQLGGNYGQYDPGAYALPQVPTTDLSMAPSAFTADGGYSTSPYGATAGSSLSSLGSLSSSPNLPSTAGLGPAAQSMGQNSPGYGAQSQIAAAAVAGAAANPNSSSSGIPWNQIFDPTLAQGQLNQQQQYLNYMLQNYLPWYQQQMAQMDQLQTNLAQAQMTGDYNGVQTLQSQLQNAQINLQNYQANMQGAIAQAQLSGQFNGAPTLEAQNLQNQFAATGGNQLLTARGQDVQAMGIEAQLAQSPLIAWYTARGLPPPQSAILQGLPTYNAPTYSWNNQNTSSQPILPNLPTTTTGGGTTPASNWSNPPPPPGPSTGTSSGAGGTMGAGINTKPPAPWSSYQSPGVGSLGAPNTMSPF